MELTVECQQRPEGSKPRALRRSGLIPANLYGHKGAESISLAVKAKTVETLLKTASVNNTVIDLDIPDIGWRGKTLLREVQVHPAKRFPYHLSFFAVGGQETIEVTVPVQFVGDAAGVKQGGVLDPVMTEIQVLTSPDNIPDVIEIDVSLSQVGDSVYVDQIELPEGVTVLNQADQPVATVLPQQVNAAAEDAAEAEASAVVDIDPDTES